MDEIFKAKQRKNSYILFSLQCLTSFFNVKCNTSQIQLFCSIIKHFFLNLLFFSMLFAFLFKRKQMEQEGYARKPLQKWTLADICRNKSLLKVLGLFCDCSDWNESLVEIGKKGMRQVIEMKGTELTGQMLADFTVPKLQDEYKLGKLPSMKIVEALDKIKRNNPPSQTNEHRPSIQMITEDTKNEEKEDGSEEHQSKSESKNVYTIEWISEYQGLIGLKNLGSTCYLNSAVQCLLQVKPLVHLFLFDHPYDYKYDYQYDSSKDWSMSISTAWSKTVYQAYTNQIKNGVYSLSALLSSLKKVNHNFSEEKSKTFI
ncbi:ubiquitin carboxyl-terminal hydrolase [Reticulomyxa filosa]|uniref:Ubiquitin carboxyl-terminal hydrolase n=1 Tax=Reticulomyxa filosa TaxID=46433 RepID=X6MV84_RETFI|nr:ubiquitin carboxyl-terminal hydrolase [Reticulomyxa filosa]|eukprot:ETO17015.1 ubiquitin carboxyl-terminal hydrolase [Reticulomyxa filosa]